LIGIINASPLIYLSKIGLIGLLPQLFDEIWTSIEVKEEVLKLKSSPEVPILEEAFTSWLKIHPIDDNRFLSKLLEMQIHRGEATIIAIARELKIIRKDPIAIIDDITAREIARTFDIPVIGTVGILLRAVKKALLSPDQFKNKIRMLVEETEFGMSVKLYSALLEKLKELIP
jgi:predicted nucleic acid-binding protein